MIISVSRRTDIPAHYAAWFFARLREGFTFSSNPFQPLNARRVPLSPDAVDGFVFWTKNPAALMNDDGFGLLDRYAYYLHYTLNSYGPDIEPSLPPEAQRLALFKRLAEKAGPHRVIWRYDPVLLNADYTPAWHQERFGSLCRRLQGHTEQAVISFVDWYAKNRRSLNALGVYRPEQEQRYALARELAAAARSAGMAISMCAEEGSPLLYGIEAAHCIDGALLARIRREMGKVEIPVRALKDRGQRLHCGCAPSIDIGVYGTCVNRCVYCYAAGKRGTGSPALENTVMDAML